MWVMVAACCVTLFVVYMIRRLSVSHAWKIAIVTGTLTNVLLLFVSVFVVGITLPILRVILNAFLAAAVGFVLEFFPVPCGLFADRICPISGRRLLLLCEGGSENCRYASGGHSDPRSIRKNEEEKAEQSGFTESWARRRGS